MVSAFAFLKYIIAISYAKEQLRLTKNWADTSESTTDGEGYKFPWTKLSGRVLVEGNEPVPMSFELDRGRLLDLLVGHTIYNDATVAVRELIQNAIDAVRYQHHLHLRENNSGDNPQIGKVRINWDPVSRILEVIDDGIGMTKSTISDHLMRVGSSFYDTPAFKSENQDFSPISRFGIGVLTYFMISDDIEIITYQENIGYRIRMSSVHADYLLKTLPPGDPELEGIQPHGTKVKLKIRPSVNLENRDVGDIVDYWVILPACEVLYRKGDGKERKVGFKSVEEALTAWAPNKEEKTFETDRKYVVNSAERDGSNYEFGVVCYKSFSPEYRFMLSGHQRQTHSSVNILGSPAVCIEGIRVAAYLPGFTATNSGKICAILSVQGNKLLKTTVSRANLEEDSEFFKIGELCIDFLLKHLLDEIENISSQEGAPLSQASSAAKSLFSQIEMGINSTHLYNFIHDKNMEIPKFVLESKDKLGNFSRTLKSNNEIIEKKEFWTHESRFANFLGIISRDFGREIGINEFLSSIAPDLVDEDLEPIIADHSRHQNELTEGFEIDKISFNKKQKKVMSRWKLRTQKLPMIDLDDSIILALGEKIDNEFGLEDTFTVHKFLSNSRSPSHNVPKNIFCADFVGDLDNTQWARFGGLLIVSNDSPEGVFCKNLEKLIFTFSSKKDTENYLENFVFSLFSYSVFKQLAENCAASGSGEYVSSTLTVDTREVRRICENIAKKTSKLIESNVENFGGHSNFNEMFVEKEKWFKSATYWFDWRQ